MLTDLDIQPWKLEMQRMTDEIAGLNATLRMKEEEPVLSQVYLDCRQLLSHLLYDLL